MYIKNCIHICNDGLRMLHVYYTCPLSFLDADTVADLVLSSKFRKLFLFKEPLALSRRRSDEPASDNLSPSMFCCCRTALNSCTTPLPSSKQSKLNYFSCAFPLLHIQINVPMYAAIMYVRGIVGGWVSYCVCVCVCVCVCMCVCVCVMYVCVRVCVYV